ncbi:hypothetical protein [Streptomyces bobili]
MAGYPEREVPLVGRKQGLMVDGIRPPRRLSGRSKARTRPKLLKAQFP